MTTVMVVVVWLVAGCVGALVARWWKWGAILAPVGGAIATLLARHAQDLGPLQGGTWVAPGLDSVGIVVGTVAAIAWFGALCAAEERTASDAWACGIGGAALIVALSAQQPFVWAESLTVGVTAVIWRWWSSHLPGGERMEMARMLALGAALCVVATPFLGPNLVPIGPRSALEGGLLAGGVTALIALPPLGGWVRSLPALDSRFLVGWSSMVVPAALVGAARMMPQLPLETQTALSDVLLVVGLTCAVYHALFAVWKPRDRPSRTLMADIGLAAAGIGSTHVVGAQGALVLLVMWACAAPLVWSLTLPALPRRLAWLSVCGFPATVGFWGRFLVLQALAGTNSAALEVGVLVVFLITASALLGAVARPTHGRDGPASVTRRSLLGALAVGTAVWGLVPALLLTPLARL